MDYSPSICYVTSQGSFNKVFIKNSLNAYIKSYIVYREGIFANQYEKIGELSLNDASFIDSLIDNRVQSYIYSVSFKDICGNESQLSAYHRTLHLSQNRGINGEVNLFWSNYIGVDILSYLIFRQVGNEEFQLLKQISSSNNTYSDYTTEPSLNYQYYIAFQMENICESLNEVKSSEFVMIKSNLVSTDKNYTSNEEILSHKFSVYPNPTLGIITIEKNLEESLELILKDINGNIIYRRSLLKQKNILNISNLADGVYFVELIKKNKKLFQQKVIKISS